MPLIAPERRLADPVQELPPLFRPRTRRARRQRAGIVRSAATVVVAALALVGLARLGDLVPSIGNPFRTERVDRTGPAVLKAVQDVHQYRAATGQFQVLVDLEKDARYLPSVIKGERTLFVAFGSVDASVDFSAIGQQSVRLSEDRKSAVITVPHAVLSPAAIDAGRSYVADRDRGLLDRIGSVFSDSPTSERALVQIAEGKVAEAAAADDALRTRAEDNTRQMLRALLAPLGFTEVTVTFV